MCHIHRNSYICGHLVYSHTVYCLRGEAGGPAHEVEAFRDVGTPCAPCIAQTAADAARREKFAARRERIRRTSAMLPIGGALFGKFNTAAEKRAPRENPVWVREHSGGGGDGDHSRWTARFAPAGENEGAKGGDTDGLAEEVEGAPSAANHQRSTAARFLRTGSTSLGDRVERAGQLLDGLRMHPSLGRDFPMREQGLGVPENQAPVDQRLEDEGRAYEPEPEPESEFEPVSSILWLASHQRHVSSEPTARLRSFKERIASRKSARHSRSERRPTMHDTHSRHHRCYQKETFLSVPLAVSSAPETPPGSVKAASVRNHEQSSVADSDVGSLFSETGTAYTEATVADAHGHGTQWYPIMSRNDLPSQQRQFNRIYSSWER